MHIRKHFANNFLLFLRMCIFCCTFVQNYLIWLTMAKILVIDDERAIRNTLKDILEFEGYSVDVAENGRAGLDKALATKYDLIYTDIKMPEMDGMEVLNAYRKTMQEQGGEVAPVVMISGHGTVETAVEALKSGAYDFIVKPLDLNRLLLTGNQGATQEDRCAQ